MSRRDAGQPGLPFTDTFGADDPGTLAVHTGETPGATRTLATAQGSILDELEDARPADARVVPTSAAYAVGRFRPEGGPTGYRAAETPDAPLRETREEAQADWLAHREPECGICHRHRPAASHGIDPDAGTYAVCADCDADPNRPRDLPGDHAWECAITGGWRQCGPWCPGVTRRARIVDPAP